MADEPELEEASATAEMYPTPADEVPVEPVAFPFRLSQTLLRIENYCPRNAYLYLKHNGQVRSHPMDRGTLAHAAAERLMVERILWDPEVSGGERAGQGPAYMPDPNLPVDEMDEALSMQTGALVSEIRRDLEGKGRIHVPHEEADIARICTYHLARGLDVKPRTVLGIERKFVIDLPRSGWEVSVKMDLAHTPEPGLVVVDDYKTAIFAPSDSDWLPFQVKVGLLAVLYGHPVEKVPCPVCGDAVTNVGTDVEVVVVPGNPGCTVCGGAATVERREQRIGGAFSRFMGRELYPRKALWQDGTIHRNEREWTRLALDEFLQDLDDAGERINERLKSWKWPARKGSWCSECTMESECPLPAKLRDHEGAVQDQEQANRLWEFALALDQRSGQVKKAVKAWARKHGASVRVGNEQWADQTQQQRSLVRRKGSSDWDGLAAAVQAAAELGKPFDMDEWVKWGPKTEFKKTKVPVDLQIGEVKVDDRNDGDEPGADERWGADAPW